MKNMLFSFINLLLVTGLPAQQPNAALDIQLNKNILQPRDSLLISVQYTDSGGEEAGKRAIATLELIIENEQGQRTRLRWPVIDGEASGALYLPQSLAQGKYTLLAGLQQRSFEVIGQVRNARNIDHIQAMLLTKNGAWDQQEVSLMSNGSFAIRNWIFEDNALLAFSGTNQQQQALDIRISTLLDSGSTVLAVAGRSFYVGNPSPEVKQSLDKPVESTEADFTDKENLLPAVLVRTAIKSPAEQFNEQYATALFRGGEERLIPIMDEPGAMGFSSVLTYLQGKVAGLQITSAGFNGGTASWRGGPVSFFLDEMRVSAQVVASIPITDIAIVKAFPPPFFGAPGGAGAVAVYTRRGGEGNYLPANRRVFKVRGYTPAATALAMEKMLL